MPGIIAAIPRGIGALGGWGSGGVAALNHRLLLLLMPSASKNGQTSGVTRGPVLRR